MRISDWSSDVCSSDLGAKRRSRARHRPGVRLELKTCDLSRCPRRLQPRFEDEVERRLRRAAEAREAGLAEHLGEPRLTGLRAQHHAAALGDRSEEHTSELQSLMRISYAGLCLKKKNNQHYHHPDPR